METWAVVTLALVSPALSLFATIYTAGRIDGKSSAAIEDLSARVSRVESILMHKRP